MTAVTTSQSQNYYAQARDIKQPASSEILQAAEAQLNANPLATLAESTFREQLRLLLSCVAKLTGSPNYSRTHKQLNSWLMVLDGDIPAQHFFAQNFTFWTWQDMANLDMEPLLACCYMRMVTDAQASAARYQGQKPAVNVAAECAA